MAGKNVNRLFIITSKLPLKIEATTEKISVYSRKNAFLAGLEAFMQQMPEHPQTAFSEVYWAGMPGCPAGTWPDVQSKIPQLSFALCPVFVHAKDHVITDGFADALERYIRPNDTLWIADSRLVLLAVPIRKRMPAISIGIFMPVGFVPFAEARKVSREGREGQVEQERQEELLKGLLGADLIGFRTEADRNDLLRCVRLTLGIDHDENIVRNEDRLVSTAVLPAPGAQAGAGDWLRSGLSALAIAKIRQQHFQVRFFDMQSKNGLLDKYRNAQKRLFLLDYDGTLTPFFHLPSLAKPDNLLLEILSDIARNPRNSVYIVSGRDSQTLESWLGHLPVNIIAEHGARVRYRQGQWEERAVPAVEWKDAVEQVMQAYSRRCLHSFVEQKDFSIVWHYRSSPPEEVKEVKMELYAELCRLVEDQGLQVMMGNKIIEVRNRGMDKGGAIRNVLLREDQDFILAIGDDRTDEDMFRMLTEVDHACTIKVGAEASFAQFNMHTPQMVISLLGNLVFLEGRGMR